MLIGSPEWGDYWMNYKNFKTIIAAITEEKKQKMESMQQAPDNNSNSSTNQDIEISRFCFFVGL